MHSKTPIKPLLFVLASLSLVTSSLHAQVSDSTLRRVPLQGAVNFRDVGGYQTMDGKKVVWGKIYRSSALSKLTDADRTELYNRRITSVFDFRNLEEALNAPDTLWQDAVYLRCGAGSEILNGWGPVLKTQATGDSLFFSFYGDVDSLGARYKPLFQKLLSQPKREAVVYHCSSGKDRTGIATALVLHALGVPEETIWKDYEASNFYRKKENERTVSILIANGYPKGVAEDLAIVKPTYLKATWDSLNKKYGSVDLFMEKELGIGPAEVKQLRDKYVK
jgi:protein-tyrosine phosphatase